MLSCLEPARENYYPAPPSGSHRKFILVTIEETPTHTQHHLVYEKGREPVCIVMKQTLSDAYAVRKSLLRLISIINYRRPVGGTARPLKEGAFRLH